MMIFGNRKITKIHRERSQEGTREKDFFKNARMGVAFAIVLVIGFAGGWYAHTPLGESVVSNVPLLGDGLMPLQTARLISLIFGKVYNILNTQYVITHASSTMPTTQDKMWGAI